VAEGRDGRRHDRLQRDGVDQLGQRVAVVAARGAAVAAAVALRAVHARPPVRAAQGSFMQPCKPCLAHHQAEHNEATPKL